MGAKPGSADQAPTTYMHAPAGHRGARRDRVIRGHDREPPGHAPFGVVRDERVELAPDLAREAGQRRPRPDDEQVVAAGVDELRLTGPWPVRLGEQVRDV